VIRKHFPAAILGSNQSLKSKNVFRAGSCHMIASSKYKEMISRLLIFCIIAGFVFSLMPLDSGFHKVRAAVPTQVVSPSKTSITHDTTPDIVVLAEAGAGLSIVEGNVEVGSGTGAGATPVTITLAHLTNGLHSLKVLTDGAGETKLPVMIIDDTEPFDIQDIVGITSKPVDTWELSLGGGGGSLGASLFAKLDFLMSGIDPGVIPTPPLPFTVTASAGVAASSTKLTFAMAGDKSYYVKVSAFPITAPKVGVLVPSGVFAYVTGNSITGVDASTNKYLGLYLANADGRVEGFTSIVLSPGDISPISLPELVTISSINAVDAQLGSFVVATASAVAGLTKDDFAVTITHNSVTESISNFQYEATTGVLTLGNSTVAAYNGKQVKVKVSASSVSTKLSGSYEVNVTLGTVTAPARVAISLVSVVDAQLGSFAVTTASAVSGLTKGDFEVTITHNSVTEPISNFQYDGATRVITLDDATINAYNGQPVKLKVSASTASTKLSGSYEVDVTLGTVTAPARVAISLVSVIDAQLGTFTVTTASTVSGLTKEDFEVAITHNSVTEPISDFQYDGATRVITLDDATINAYNGQPVKLKVSASTASTKLSGSYEVDVTLGTPAVVSIRGVVSNASGIGVEHIELKFRQGENNRTGTALESITTGPGGSYEVMLSPGIYTVELSGTSYVQTFLTRDLKAGLNPENDLSVINIPQNEEIQIVLTWGSLPKDLDSHLIGPKIRVNDSNTHIYYGDKQITVGSAVYAKLDFDLTHGHGPEMITTTTVLQQVYGTYTYYVNQYSWDGALPTSSAKVEIYKGNSDTPFKTYAVPTTPSSSKYWNVFNMVITSSGVTLVDTNTLQASAPQYVAPTITPTSITSITGAGNSGFTVNLANPATSGITLQDYSVTAKVYNVTTSVYQPISLTSLAYNPVTHEISYDSVAIPFDWGATQLLIEVGPSNTTSLLTGSAATANVNLIAPLVYRLEELEALAGLSSFAWMPDTEPIGIAISQNRL
jgi:hypothetical protein